MKWAQAHVVLSGLLELDVLADNLYDIGCLPNLLLGLREIHILPD